jgi:hypothetical protein
MKRLVGRRVVETEVPKIALLVTVQRRWPWQQEDFYSEVVGEIDVNVMSHNGALVITTPTKTRAYSPSQWRSVTKKIIPSRSRV